MAFWRTLFGLGSPASVPIFTSTDECYRAMCNTTDQLRELQRTGIEIPEKLQKKIAEIAASMTLLSTTHQPEIDAHSQQMAIIQEKKEMEIGASLFLITLWAEFLSSIAKILLEKKILEFDPCGTLELTPSRIYEFFQDIRQCLLEINTLLLEKHLSIFPPNPSSIHLPARKVGPMFSEFTYNHARFHYGFVTPPSFKKKVQLLKPRQYASDVDDGERPFIDDNYYFDKNDLMKNIFKSPSLFTERTTEKLYTYLDEIDAKITYEELWERGLQDNIMFVDPDQNIDEGECTLNLFFQIKDSPNFFEEM